MGEGYAFDEPRRAAQERTQVLRMDFPHSMRPSIDTEFPGPENETRGVGRSKRRPYIHYLIHTEFPSPEGGTRGTGRSRHSSETLRPRQRPTYTSDTSSNKSERG